MCPKRGMINIKVLNEIKIEKIIETSIKIKSKEFKN